MSCPFEKLGLPPSASQADVKAAYRSLGEYAHLPFQPFGVRLTVLFVLRVRSQEVSSRSEQAGPARRGPVQAVNRSLHARAGQE